MKNMNWIAALIVVAMWTSAGLAQSKSRIYGRLIWQDTADQKIHWGDLRKGKEWTLEKQAVDGQPELDAERHMFVQMQCIDQVAVVGVRDDDDGKFQSGWFALDTGVKKEAHGDHFHWHFSSNPKVIATVMDENQGNPAHVYSYSGGFYIANDKKDGFTLVTPGLIGKPNAKPDQFFLAGGGHITLAAVDGKVAYSTWIDRAGDNKGRVDVVGLGSNAGRGYHFHLPSGGLHGATTISGKVFFAPTDGLCWVDADLAVAGNEADVDVKHISLGETAEGVPLRTGAFENANNHLLFTVGGNTLCTLDAKSSKPVVSKVAISIAEGNRLTTPKAVQSRTGERFALLFEESANGDNEEKLHVVALDPNLDGRTDDATLQHSLTVGRSLIEGHSGHHELVPISRRYLAISNPGDGTISVVSTSTWEVESTLKVSGTPTRMIVVGG